MGRPPGVPSFRFNSSEVAEMEALLQKHEGNVPPRDLLMALADGFSNSPDRAGKVVVQMKQVWSWFQNRRCALRTKLVKSPGTPSISPVPLVRNVHHVPQQMAVSSGSQVVKNTSEGFQMDFEAKSARDSAWYDVQAFISHRYLETDNPEVLVRFAGFGPEEDEWVNILKHVRQRSLPCEAAECIVVTAGDLILCFQEGKEQALYFDAHVLDAQRRRHDVRGCRCRFLVHFDHDQSEEIVPLRKICRRPETDYRLQILHTENEALSKSVSKAPPKHVVDNLTSTNPNHNASTIPVHLPPNVSVAPSAQPTVIQTRETPTPTAFTLVQALTSAPIRPPAPRLVGNSAPSPPPTGPPTPSSALVVNLTPTLTSVPASPSPLPVSSPFSASVTVGVPEILESRKVESDTPAECPPPECPPPEPKSESDNPAQVLLSPAESISVPLLATEPEKVEIDDPPPLVTDPDKTPKPMKVKSDDPAPVSISESNKVESDDPAPVSMPESNKVESDDPAPASMPKPNKVESDDPAPVSMPESNKVESDDPAPASIPKPDKVEDENPIPVPATARVATDEVDSVNVKTWEARLGAQGNVLSPTVENTVMKAKSVEHSNLVSGATTESGVSSGMIPAPGQDFIEDNTPSDVTLEGS